MVDGIEMTHQELMESIAAGIDSLLNGTDAMHGKIARKSGFVLLVFPFGQNTHHCHYISNGCAYDDAIRMFKALIERHEEKLKEQEDVQGG